MSQDGDGTYAGYRVRQECIAAGSTDQDGARVKATIDFTYVAMIRGWPR